ncbi:MAG: cell division protein ZapA [Alphaproteobacteria bacterium]|nr:cell division protein ZapA [Alphaproteobacteria bacterium]MBV9552776.1 cell division protein ZapA [Alphaproteobacteria bacterium]
MGQVVVTVNGRAFPLSCNDGEEPRIRRLAQYVDGKIGEFVNLHGQVGEARLLLLAALLIADELSDANDQVQAERTRQRIAADAAPAASATPDPAVVAGILGLARRIESIAARFETT